MKLSKFNFIVLLVLCILFLIPATVSASEHIIISSEIPKPFISDGYNTAMVQGIRVLQYPDRQFLQSTVGATSLGHWDDGWGGDVVARIFTTFNLTDLNIIDQSDIMGINLTFNTDYFSEPVRVNFYGAHWGDLLTIEDWDTQQRLLGEITVSGDDGTNHSIPIEYSSLDDNTQLLIKSSDESKGLIYLRNIYLEFDIKVHPTADFEVFTPTIGMSPHKAFFSDRSVPGGDPYYNGIVSEIWQYRSDSGWTTFTPDDHSCFVFTNPGNYDIKLTVTNTDGISDEEIKLNCFSVTPMVVPVTGGGIGKIAFVSERDGNPEIYVMNSDGSEQARITENPGIDTYPAWSPDGSKIAFVSTRDGNYDIYVMDADGNNVSRLTYENYRLGAYTPAWSPDGAKIAFKGRSSSGAGGGSIYLMDVNGSNPAYFSEERGVGSPTWSPDGTRIAYRHGIEGVYEIVIRNVDGSGSTVIPADIDPNGLGQLSWSPDGTKIAYDSYWSKDGISHSGISIMNTGGVVLDRLTDDTRSCGDNNPAWFPDGSKIVFASSRAHVYDDIYVINADGSGKTRITFTNNNYQPSWGKVTTKGSDGLIEFIPSKNTDSDNDAQVIVIDPDLNKDPNIQETVEVHLESWYRVNNQEHLSEISTITLLEQSLNSYTFNTTIHFDTVGHPGFGPEYVSVHPYYPGRINVTYIDALDSKGITDVERTASADYLFGYNVTITSKGKFVNSPHIVETKASVPLIVTVKDGDEPVRGADIYLNDESATSFLTLSLGQTDINGNLTCDILLDEINETNIVGKPITVYAEKSQEKRGLSQPFVAVEKTEKFSNPKILTTGDVALYTTYALIIHQIEGLFDIVTNIEVWIVDKCLSENGVHFFSETYSTLTTYAYWEHEMNYHPTTGDKLDLVGYNYSAPDVLTAYRLDLIIYPRVDPSNVIKRSYWVNSENTGPMTIDQIRHILRITILSPAVVYVTAPDGSHAGYDPQTGQLVQEFPCFISEPGDEPFLIYIPTDQIGEYRIDVVGTGSGSYTMTADVFDENMIIQNSATYSQLTNTGMVTSYKINLPETGDVVISPTNQPPDLVNPKDQTITEGKTLTLNLVATDPDNDPLTYSFTSTKTLPGASISRNTFTWTPASGTAGTYPVKFNVTDSGGLSDEEAINITVNAPIPNTPPNLTNPGDKSVSEGSTLQITLAASDTEGDQLAYLFKSTKPLPGASISGNIFTWTPRSGSAGTYSVTFNVTDSGGLSDRETIKITVNKPVKNTPPVLTNPGDKSVSEGSVLKIILVASDKEGGPLAYSFTSTKTLPGASITGNIFTWTPGSGTAGTYSVTFNVTDSGGLSDRESIKITVNALVTNVPTNVKIIPRTINLGSKGYFLAFVTLPDSYKDATIDMNTVSCSGAPAVRMMRLKIFPRIVGFVFKTSDLKGVPLGTKVPLTMQGKLTNTGKTYIFTGADSVKVISKPSWQPDDIKDVSKDSDDQLFKKYSI